MHNISFKVYNNRKTKKLHRMITSAGFLWNHCVALQRRYYKLYGGYITTNKLQKHVAKLRKKNVFWKELNSQSIQEVCQRLDKSYKRFFNKKSSRPPKFKKSKFFNSFVLKQSGWKIEGNILTIQKVKYKFSKSRHYENIKTITVKRNQLGELFFVLCCDINLKSYERVGNSTIGIDFGMKKFLTISNGTEIDSPLFLTNDLARLRKQSRNFSKKERGSNNRKRSLKNLQRLHLQIANKRSDFEWKLSHYLCQNNAFISIEDLNLRGMVRRWGRKISDLSFGSFVLKLIEVAKKYGTIIQKVGKFYASSKTCGFCGQINKELKLSDRRWTCHGCNSTHDRDLNASKNILTEGIRLYRTESKTDFKLAF